MENASKALIIAGAILLSILIIALGVFIFNQAKSSVGNVGLSDQEVAAFNSKWEQYEGTQMGSSVRALVTNVNNYNRTANDDRYIVIESSSKGYKKFQNQPATDYSKSTYNPGTSYKITFDYTSGGLICAINIADSSSNDGDKKGN